MKICSLYGAGFYYIPGTDTCIKIGGYLRAEWDFNAGGSFTPFVSGANALFSRGGDQVTTRARGTVTFDVREQTQYGTLRSYLWGGWNYTTGDAPTLSLPGSTVGAAGGAPGLGPNSNAFLLRAFVQFAGFTFGKAGSVFDFFDTGRYSHQTNFLYQDDGGVGVNQIAYTHSFGNGFSASIALEDQTFFAHGVRDLGQAGPAGTVGGAFGASLFPILAAGGPTNPPLNNAGNIAPDITMNLRVDQAWGSAQIMAGFHDNRARYYQTTANGLTAGAARPDDKWGWAIGAGAQFNVPTGAGDTLAVQGTYCEGWSGRCANNSGAGRADLAFGLVNGGNTIGLGWLDDAYSANTAATGATGLQLPRVWNVIAGFQHYWVPSLRTSLYGGYVNYEANSTAVDTLACTANGFAAGCADWAAWNVGSRTIWNPAKNLDIGVDIMYTDLDKSAFRGGTVTFAPAGAAAATYSIGSTHVWAGIFRVQRNFWP